MADSAAVTRLLKTARGQLDGILRMVEQDAYCMDISTQLLACDAILRKTNAQILEAHLHSCVRDAFESGDRGAASEKIQEITSLLKKMGL